MKYSFPIVITFCLVLAIACKNGSNPAGNSDNQPPGPFSVIVDTTGLDPVLTWTSTTDPDGDPVTYSVLLEGQQVETGLTDTIATLKGLEYESKFSGKIVASDNKGGSSEADFEFTSRDIRIEWQVNFGDTGGDLALAMDETSDGGYIVAGYSSEGNLDPGNGSDDYRIMKLDADGNIEWNRQYGGSSSDRAFSVRQTIDGSYIVAGRSYSGNGDVAENNGDRDYWIIKLDAAGELITSNNFGGDRAEIARSIQQTGDGGFIVAGSTQSSDTLDIRGVNNGASDFWIVKINSAMEIDWEKNYGDSTFEQAHAVQESLDGGYIVAGTTSSDEPEESGSADGWIIKLSASGELERQTTLGGSDADQIFDAQQTSDDGFVLAGSSRSVDGDLDENYGKDDFWVVKLDNLLNVIWSRNFGGSEGDRAFSVYPAHDDGFLVAGSSFSVDQEVSGNKGSEDFWIIKIDTDGDLIWEKNFGGSNVDVAHSIFETADKGIVIAGYSRSDDGDVLEHVNNHDFWIVKLK